MAALETAAQKHHSDVSSSVLIHIRKATATTLAKPKTAMGRRLETRSERSTPPRRRRQAVPLR